MAQSATVVWFRQDLRLADHAALTAAAAARGAVVPVYIWSPEEEGGWPPGAASRWWLHHSLAALAAELRRRGSRLRLRRGPAAAVLLELAAECDAGAVFWSRRYEPAARRQEQGVSAALTAAGLEARAFSSALLAEPEEMTTAAGTPYRVFTPFWRALQLRPQPAAPLAVPGRLTPPRRWPASLPLEAFELLPRPDWAGGLRQAWQPGEAAAAARLGKFVRATLRSYPQLRDRPGAEGTSRLSPHLHFGEISPRQVWHAVVPLTRRRGPAGAAARAFLRQLAWREFAHHLLWHFPQTATAPLREVFARFPWARGAAAALSLRTWQRGQTGYPLVDAGMRELWRTGWMHNRVRMVAASLLTKHLLVPWQRGAEWFWDTLVDADLANNTLGWQWVAGSGADAVPYFRIFNPAEQGRKFDPTGEYVRRWVPELGQLDARWIHRPWAAPRAALAAAGVELGRTYPWPIVDHATARGRALAAWAAVRRSRKR